jgi:hypothetical protein
MRVTVAAIGLVMMVSGAASAQSVGGKYTVNGTNFDGSPYKGTATITRSSNSTCAINWVTARSTACGPSPANRAPAPRF